MELLLDTHAFLWADGNDPKLSGAARAAMAAPSNRVYLSVASLWEIQIKNQLGKLPLRLPLNQLVSDHLAKQSIQVLPVEPSHVFELQNLGDHHKDPFDRLIVATARCRRATVISIDPLVQQYDVDWLW